MRKQTSCRLDRSFDQMVNMFHRFRYCTNRQFLNNTCTTIFPLLSNQLLLLVLQDSLKPRELACYPSRSCSPVCTVLDKFGLHFDTIHSTSCTCPLILNCCFHTICHTCLRTVLSCLASHRYSSLGCLLGRLIQWLHTIRLRSPLLTYRSLHTTFFLLRYTWLYHSPDNYPALMSTNRSPSCCLMSLACRCCRNTIRHLEPYTLCHSLLGKDLRHTSTILNLSLICTISHRPLNTYSLLKSVLLMLWCLRTDSYLYTMANRRMVKNTKFYSEPYILIQCLLDKRNSYLPDTSPLHLTLNTIQQTLMVHIYTIFLTVLSNLLRYMPDKLRCCRMSTSHSRHQNSCTICCRHWYIFPVQTVWSLWLLNMDSLRCTTVNPLLAKHTMSDPVLCSQLRCIPDICMTCLSTLSTSQWHHQNFYTTHFPARCSLIACMPDISWWCCMYTIPYRHRSVANTSCTLARYRRLVDLALSWMWSVQTRFQLKMLRHITHP